MPTIYFKLNPLSLSNTAKKGYEEGTIRTIEGFKKDYMPIAVIEDADGNPLTHPFYYSGAYSGAIIGYRTILDGPPTQARKQHTEPKGVRKIGKTERPQITKGMVYPQLPDHVATQKYESRKATKSLSGNAKKTTGSKKATRGKKGTAQMSTQMEEKYSNSYGHIDNYDNAYRRWL